MIYLDSICNKLEDVIEKLENKIEDIYCKADNKGRDTTEKEDERISELQEEIDEIENALDYLSAYRKEQWEKGVYVWEKLSKWKSENIIVYGLMY